MTSKQLESLADGLKTLGHRVRLQILLLLSEQGETNVSTIFGELGLEQSLISHHLDKMYNRKLLVRRREGKTILYRLSDDSPVVSSVLNLVKEHAEPADKQLAGVVE